MLDDLFYSSEHFQAFFERSSQSLILKANSPKFTILAVSDKYLELTHKDRKELLNKNLFEVFPDINPSSNEQQIALNCLRSVIDTKQRVELPIFKYEIFLKDLGKHESFYWSNVN